MVIYLAFGQSDNYLFLINNQKMEFNNVFNARTSHRRCRGAKRNRN